MGNLLTRKKPITTHDNVDVSNKPIEPVSISNTLKKVEKEKVFNIAIKNSHTSMMLLMTVKYFYTIKFYLKL